MKPRHRTTIAGILLIGAAALHAQTRPSRGGDSVGNLRQIGQAVLMSC
jgi:hypothetical protein